MIYSTNDLQLDHGKIEDVMTGLDFGGDNTKTRYPEFRNSFCRISLQYLPNPRSVKIKVLFSRLDGAFIFAKEIEPSYSISALFIYRVYS